MMIIRIDRVMQHRINAWLAGFWFLMPAILFPLNALKIPPFKIVIASIFLLVSLIVNKFQLNKRMLSFLCIYLTLIVVNLVICPESVVDYQENTYVWLSTIGYGIVSLFLAATVYDTKYILNIMNKIAMAVVVSIVFCMNNDSILTSIRTLEGWYMLMGFSLMIPLAVMVVHLSIKGGWANKCEMLIYIGGLITLLMYGNRGAWMCHGILYVLLILYYGYKRGKIARYILCVMTVIIYAIANSELLIEKCLEIISETFDEFIPYTWGHLIDLYKYGDVERFSAGRIEIWRYAVKSASENILWGNYIGFIHKLASSVHNIFLEILCDYGVFVFVTFLIYMIYMIYTYIKFRPLDDVPLLIVFFSCACEQMTSGYMFLENNFMFLLGLIVATKCKDKGESDNAKDEFTMVVSTK